MFSTLTPTQRHLDNRKIATSGAKRLCRSIRKIRMPACDKSESNTREGPVSKGDTHFLFMRNGIVTLLSIHYLPSARPLLPRSITSRSAASRATTPRAHHHRRYFDPTPPPCRLRRPSPPAANRRRHRRRPLSID